MEKLYPGLFDSLSDTCCLVSRVISHDDGVAFRQFGNQHLFHIGQEDHSNHWAVKDPGGFRVDGIPFILNCNVSDFAGLKNDESWSGFLETRL